MSEPTGVRLMHTEGMVAVVISEAGQVSVDVEAVDRKYIPPTDFSALGLSSGKAAHLAAQSEPDRSETFIDLWKRQRAGDGGSQGVAPPRCTCKRNALCSSRAIF